MSEGQGVADEDVAGWIIFIQRNHGGLADMTVAGAIGAGCLEHPRQDCGQQGQGDVDGRHATARI